MDRMRGLKRLIKISMKTEKEFWAFVGKTSKGSRKGIASLRSTSGSCVTSTKGKLDTALLDDQFDDSWKKHIDKKMTEYNRIE